MQELLSKAVFWLFGVQDPGSITRALEWQWYTASPVSRAVLIGLGVLALIAAGVNLLPRAGMPWRTRITLIVLRLLGFAIVALLFVQLELRVTVERALSPNIAVVRDISGSMGIKDSGERTRLDVATQFSESLVDRLGSDMNLPAYDLSWSVQATDAEATPAGMTRIMSGLRDVLRQERSLQAVILLSDGNDTLGDEGQAVAPLFAARGVPVYPVVFGDPEMASAPSVKFTGGGDYVRLGDELRLEATLSAPQFKGETATASLYEGKAKAPLLPPKQVRIAEKPSLIEFVFRPDKPGRKEYRIVIDGLKGAPTRKLLEATHEVDVIDQKIRVLFVDIPRDERKIVGHWLARDPVVDLAGLLMLPKQGWSAQGELRHRNVDGLPQDEADLYEYDVIILGDIPRKYFRKGDPEETRLKWFVDFVQRRGGGLITLGGRSVYAAGQYHESPLATILPFSIERARKPQIEKTFKVIPTDLGYSHPIMRLERDFDANRDAWLDLPDVEGCNRVGEVRPGATLLANNNTPEGDVPAIAFQNTGKGKVLSLTVDTTWRWEFMRPRGSEVDGEAEGVDYFRRFWGNAVRFISPDPRLEPEQPRIAKRKSEVAVGETIRLSTRLVDRLFKPIRNADLTVRVTPPTGRELRIFPSDGRSEPGLYEYEVTLDQPGIWKIAVAHKEPEALAAIAAAQAVLDKAEADEDDIAIADAKRRLAFAESRIAREEITAGESADELEDPRAHPFIMDSFAMATGGQTYSPEQIDDLVEKLKPATHLLKQNYAIAIWNLPATMVLLIIIICLDCYIRKRRGLV